MGGMVFGLLDIVLDFFFPRACVGCARSGSFLCKDCLQKIPLRTSQPCAGCNAPSTEGTTCRACAQTWALEKLWAISSYEKKTLLSQAIHTLKYKHTESLALLLGEWMADHFSAEYLSFDGIVPIPLHPSRERARGYNQARLLADVLAARTGLPILEGLQRTRPTSPQARESKIQRLKNLRQAFFVDPLNSTFLNKKVILIDDVCSTGSTLNEAAKTLKSAGCKSVMGLVLARA